MKKIILLSMVLFITILNVTAQAWQYVGTQGFSPAITQYSLTALGIDQNGIPYVAFSDASNSGDMSVMKFNGSSWVYVGNADFSAGQGYDMSIAFDNNNSPWVAFGDGGNSSHTTVMKFDGTNWVNVGTAGFSDGVVNNCTIKFDGSNTPYVAYVDNYYSGKAVVKKFNGSNWVNVGTPGFTAGGTGQMTMALNHSGQPYVGYQDQANGFAESVMMYNGSNWVHVGANTFSAGTVQFTHIVFDSAGTTPYVCYNSGSGTFAPNVEMFNGSNWQYVGGANFNNDQDYQNNIALNGSNIPYVIFPDWTYSGRAAVMKYNGSWTAVGSFGFSSGEIWYPNIAVDAWGNVYVEYYDDGDADKVSVLKFGSFGPTQVTAKFTANDTAVCQNSSVAFNDQSVGSPTKWQWTFTGGTPDTSSSQNPTIVYNEPGTYNVKLVASNSAGPDSITKTGYITVTALPVAGAVTGSPDSVCSGGVAQLSVSGDTGIIQWQSSLDANSFANIQGANSGTYNSPVLTQTTYYRVELTSGACGTDSSNVKTIFVATKPVAGTVTGSPDTICFGGTSQLSVSGDNSAIQWQSSIYPNSFSDIQGAQSETYNTSATTITTYYRVEATSSICGTDSSNIQMIFVTPSPLVGTILPATDTVCMNTVVNLASSGSLADIFQWQSSTGGNNFTAINDADTSTYITPPLSQTTSFRLIALNGTCADTSASAIVTVDNLPAPVLSVNDSLICSNDSALIQTLGSYSSYAWSNSDTNAYIYVNGAGGYWVTVADANGCSAVSNHQNISVYPVPSVSIAVSSDTLFSHNATSYQWYNDSGAIPGATDSTYVAGQTGNYWVQVTDSNGCTAPSGIQHVIVTGNENITGNTEINIYPNPFSTGIAITIQKPGLTEVSFTINNLLGQQLFNIRENTLSNSLTKTLDLSYLPDGVYLLEIETGGEKVVKKIVKQ